MLDLTKFKVYIVGGYVRDRLLSRDANDHDFVVVGATPQDMLDAGFQQVGADFPVFLSTLTGDEYALARTERKTSPGYKGFDVVFDPSVTLEDDLRRRDLTINAMAREVIGWDEIHGYARLKDEIIDPFNGQQDLRDGVLRHVSEAFAEDPLRILRTARFRARYNFDIHKSTMELMKQLVQAGEVDHLTPERVWAELENALMEQYPTRFFWTLDECGASEKIIPELYRKMIYLGKSLDATAMHTTYRTVRFSVLMSSIPPWKVREVCQRMKAPNNLTDVAYKCSTVVSAVRAGNLSPTRILEVLESIDAFRNPADVKEVAHATLFLQDGGMADGVHNILLGLRAAQTVTFGSLSATEQQELKGREIGEAIRNKRIEAIRSIYR